MPSVAAPASSSAISNSTMEGSSSARSLLPSRFNFLRSNLTKRQPTTSSAVSVSSSLSFEPPLHRPGEEVSALLISPKRLINCTDAFGSLWKVDDGVGDKAHNARHESNRKTARVGIRLAYELQQRPLFSALRGPGNAQAGGIHLSRTSGLSRVPGSQPHDRPERRDCPPLG